jgi:beta-galactosidase
LKRYVETGGTLVLTQRTGVKDESNTVVNQRLPGLLAEICGVEVEEYDSLSSHMQNSLQFTIPELVEAPCMSVGILCDILKPVTATVVAQYMEDYYAGKPAITLNRYGAGNTVYVGTMGDAQLYDLLAKWLLNIAGLQDSFIVPPGVEVAQRTNGQKSLQFILNHNSSSQTIHFERPYANLLDGRKLSGDVQVAPFDVLILDSSDQESKTSLS